MPYTGANDPTLPDYVKRLAEVLREIWVRAYMNAMEAGKSEAECFEAANAAVKAARANMREAEDDEGEDWKLTPERIRILLRIIDAALKEKRREREERASEAEEEEPSPDASLEELIAGLWRMCPARAGKTWREYLGDMRDWVDKQDARSVAAFRRRLVMIGAKMGMGDLSMKEAVVPITEACAFEAVADSPEGREWAVTIVRAGWSKNRNYYSPHVLQKAAPLYQGVQVFDNHLTEEEFARKPFRSVRDLVGALREVYWDSARNALRGRLVVVDEGLRKKLKEAYEAGVLGSVAGLSHTVAAERREGEAEGQRGQIVEAIRQVLSVDIVSRPSAGGSLDYVLAAEPGAVETEEDEMSEEKIAELRQQILAEVQQMMKPATDEELAKMKAELERLREEQKKALCEAQLEAKLAQSDLPQVYKDHTRKQFAGRIFEAAELDEWLEEMRRLWAAVTDTGKVRGHGAITDIKPLRTIEGYWQKLVDLAFDPSLKGQPEYADLPWVGIREVYQSLTGDVNLQGVFNRDLVQEAAATTSTMAELVRNALNKRLLKGYRARPRWWDPIVTVYREPDLNTVSLIRVASFQMLDAVSEGAAYVEKAWDDKRETVDLSKYGNYVGITLEAIDRDNVRGFGRVVEELGKAAWKRVSYLVSYQFTQNSGVGPALSDSNYWFDAANHLNYNASASALSFDAFEAAAIALYKQRDMSYNGSTWTGTAGQDELGFEPKFLLVPPDLRGVALRIRDSENRPGTADNDRNPYYQRFEVITVPNWTDTNDYVLMVDPNDIEVLTLHFLRNEVEPSIFRAGDELGGALFTNDEIRYKVRFFVGCGVADFRGVYKCAVS